MNKTSLVANLVSSNAPGPLAHDIRTIKGPVAIPNLWFWIWLILGVVLAASLAWWAWRRWRKKELAATPEVVVLPHERARQRLQEALALLDQPRPFCILVSDTIRVYLEERFSLRAPERTTEEFLEELPSSALLTFDQKRALGEFLMSCDLVKFARYEPGPAELNAIYDAAIRLVDETQPPPPLPEPGAAPAAQPTTGAPQSA